MIIIIEGIDRVGKTTLCNKLSAKLNIPIYKHSQNFINYSYMENMRETEKMICMLDICKVADTNIIFDRFHFSDYVYGIIERKYDKVLATKNLLILDNMLARMNAIIIHMCPTDIYSSSEQHGKDLTPYFELMNYAHDISKTLVYSCDYNHIDDMVKEVKELLHEKSSL